MHEKVKNGLGLETRQKPGCAIGLREGCIDERLHFERGSEGTEELQVEEVLGGNCAEHSWC